MTILFYTATCRQLTAYIASVPDSALTASDSYFDGVDHGPTNSRLFTQAEPGVHTAGWAADQPPTTDKYLQVSN